MPVKIRLMRIGAKKRPFYRVVAVDERSKRTGKYLELLGTYNPLTEPKEIILKQDRIDDWLKKGAVLSDGYLRIIKKAPQKPPRKPKKDKTPQAAQAQPAAEAVVEVTQEQPTAETESMATNKEEPSTTPESAPAEPESTEEAESVETKTEEA